MSVFYKTLLVPAVMLAINAVKPAEAIVNFIAAGIFGKVFHEIFHSDDSPRFAGQPINIASKKAVDSGIKQIEPEKVQAKTEFIKIVAVEQVAKQTSITKAVNNQEMNMHTNEEISKATSLNELLQQHANDEAVAGHNNDYHREF